MADTEKSTVGSTAVKSSSQGLASVGPLPRQAVYIGPNNPYGYPLLENTVLCGDETDTLKKLRTEHPDLSRLFVTVGHLPAARVQKRQPGSLLAQLFAKVQAESRTLAAKKE